MGLSGVNAWRDQMMRRKQQAVRAWGEQPRRRKGKSLGQEPVWRLMPQWGRG